jgi:hypothetical protein
MEGKLLWGLRRDRGEIAEISCVGAVGSAGFEHDEFNGST